MTKPLAALAALVLLAALAGCGSDSSGETTANADTSTAVSIQSPTSPIPTTTAAPTTTAGGKQKTRETTSTTTGGSAPCSIPDAFQDLKFTGLDCNAALTVARAWDANGKTCNTVDNPNVDAGYNRTCSVEGFTCAAKRDVHSDNRFVTCTQGGQSIRFTWLPA
ncbi:MAG TPA: hypothetical protein VI035_04695 [Solirubrobacterales bacterium]